MAYRKRALLAGGTLGLVASWLASFSCFESGKPSDAGDASDSTIDTTLDAACTSPFGACSDAAPIDPCDSSASVALRIRAMFDLGSPPNRGCWGGPESGCHSDGAGSNMLLIDPDSSTFPYATYGLINVPSSELPDVMRVVPFHPESSYLYWKVSGDPRIADGSGIMPLADPTNFMSGTVVPCYEALAQSWIEAGAP